MKSLDNIKELLKAELPQLKNRFHVSYLGIFGSYVRNEEKPESDIDLLVEFNQPVTLFDIVDIEDYLTLKLKSRVEIVMKAALRKRIGKKILEEVVSV